MQFARFVVVVAKWPRAKISLESLSMIVAMLVLAAKQGAARCATGKG